MFQRELLWRSTLIWVLRYIMRTLKGNVTDNLVLASDIIYHFSGYQILSQRGCRQSYKRNLLFCFFPHKQGKYPLHKMELVMKYAKYKYPYFHFLIRDCSASSILIIQVVSLKYMLKYTLRTLCWPFRVYNDKQNRVKKRQQFKNLSF